MAARATRATRSANTPAPGPDLAHEEEVDDEGVDPIIDTAPAVVDETSNVDDSAVYTLARMRELPGVEPGLEAHLIEGAAALKGWNPETELTKKELKSAIREFLSHRPARDEEAS